MSFINLNEIFLKQLITIKSKMKTLTVFIFSLIFLSSGYGQSNKWSTILYSYSKGPVSPEFQYSYTILIYPDRSGTLTYTKSSGTRIIMFGFGYSGLSKLNSALKKSKVFTLSPEQMKSDNNLLGGPSGSAKITMWQSPNVDAMPTIIEIPANVNPEYSEGIENLYRTIEGLVPDSVWNEVK